jgi:flagellum-specific ATP synthase
LNRSLVKGKRALLNFTPLKEFGKVMQVVGLLVEATGPELAIGSTVEISNSNADQIVGEVVGFKQDKLLIMPFMDLKGIRPNSLVCAAGDSQLVNICESHLGRVIDPLGNPIDGLPELDLGDKIKLYTNPPNPVSRRRIEHVFDCGIKAINSFLTVGVGQRVGIMAGSGVGKSTLLGMISRFSESEINIIALVGERGREVREFIEKDLGEVGLSKSIVVVATSDSSPLLRIRAAFLATTYAEYFRNKGKKVLLMVDSLTRLAMAQREIGLAVGEPPSSKGYTPSVFSLLPRLLERSGLADTDGSITAFYTVLVEGDDMNEPIADAVRGILDGHIVLTRSLANAGHFPAIEILESISRVMSDVTSREHRQVTAMARDLLATYREAQDLISIGAYKQGQNAKIDRAIEKIDLLNLYLRQDSTESCDFSQSLKLLTDIL